MKVVGIGIKIIGAVISVVVGFGKSIVGFLVEDSILGRLAVSLLHEYIETVGVGGSRRVVGERVVGERERSGESHMYLFTHDKRKI